ncbi:hypothetical protein D3C73_1308510 [compost metagenome]
MRNGMIAANVVIKRSPIVSVIRVPSRLSVLRIGIAKHIPATAGVAIHRVSLAHSGTAASWAFSIYPIGDTCEYRFAITLWCIILYFR